VSSDSTLQADDAERRERERARAVAVVEIPILRCIGSAFLSLGVYLNNQFLLHTATNAE
jgi:hypothetical protein